MLYKYFLVITIVLLSLLPNWAQSATNIHQLCKSEAANCLKLLPELLLKSEPATEHWYRLKYYQIENMYTMLKLEQLAIVLEQLEPFTESAPEGFKLSYFIAQAKVNQYFKRFERAQIYSNLAASIFEAVNQSFSNPETLISFANLKILERQIAIELEQKEKASLRLSEARSALVRIESLFKNHSDPVFHRELYSNLGHVYRMQGNFDKALLNYQTALFWSQQDNNLQQTAVTNYNVARAFQEGKRFTDALKYFKQAQLLAYQSRDMATYVISQIRQSQCLFGMEEYQDSRKLLQATKKYKLTAVTQNLYSELSDKLKQKGH